MSVAAVYHALGSIARKELLHILRDRRILVLVLTLPPMFTLIFGYAFEHAELHDVPTLVVNADGGTLSEAFIALLKEKPYFEINVVQGAKEEEIDLLKAGIAARIDIPEGWSDRIKEGNPIPLGVILDGTDTNTAAYLEGYLRKALAEFQLQQRDAMIETLPDEVFEMGENLPVAIRKQFVSAMEPWEIEARILYNPEMRVIDYVTPGIIGLILQLLTVTLMACTITRERESGTLAQLRVTSLTRGEIVIGKVLPYLLLSVVLILVIIAVAAFHFHVEFRNLFKLSVICLLFLLCSLGLGLAISAISESQTQAIQIAVLFLLPVFPLSGAFAPLQQLPTFIQGIAQIFPLTHFCRAFRLVNLGNVGWSMIAGDLLFLVGGAIVTCVGAALLLNVSDD